jgi:hypothetical protein
MPRVCLIFGGGGVIGVGGTNGGLIPAKYGHHVRRDMGYSGTCGSGQSYCRMGGRLTKIRIGPGVFDQVERLIARCGVNGSGQSVCRNGAGFVSNAAVAESQV